MIPQAYITEWSNQVPWQTNEQVEQDLVICRALVEIFSDPFLSERLAFRGGTALHKLYLQPQPRYSEDIDLVQINEEPFGPVIDRLRERLSFLGEPVRKQKEHNNTLVFRFESEFPPTQKLRLKVETNCREHFTILGLEKIPFNVDSSWFKGACEITTYTLEELLGTKLRALYQRRKGRDLFDLHKALKSNNSINDDKILTCYLEYIRFSTGQAPSQQQFWDNMEAKMKDTEFIGDITALLRPEEAYDHKEESFKEKTYIDSLNLILPSDFIQKRKTLFFMSKELASYNFYPELKKINCRTLIIHGDYDAIPVELAKRINESIHNSKLVIIQDAGHFPFIEQKLNYFNAVESFLTNR